MRMPSPEESLYGKLLNADESVFWMDKRTDPTLPHDNLFRWLGLSEDDSDNAIAAKVEAAYTRQYDKASGYQANQRFRPLLHDVQTRLTAARGLKDPDELAKHREKLRNTRLNGASGIPGLRADARNLHDAGSSEEGARRILVKRARELGFPNSAIDREASRLIADLQPWETGGGILVPPPPPPEPAVLRWVWVPGLAILLLGLVHWSMALVPALLAMGLLVWSAVQPGLPLLAQYVPSGWRRVDSALQYLGKLKHREVASLGVSCLVGVSIALVVAGRRNTGSAEPEWPVTRAKILGRIGYPEDAPARKFLVKPREVCAPAAGLTNAACPELAMDADRDTAWKPSNGPLGQWLEVEFQESLPIDGVAIMATGTPAQPVHRYEIEFENEDKTEISITPNGAWNVIPFAERKTRCARLVLMPAGAEASPSRDIEIKEIWYYSADPAATPASWQGAWSMEGYRLRVTQQEQWVFGKYPNGRITAKVVGNGLLVGTWSKEPTHHPPEDAGDFEFRLASDGNSFKGRYRYGIEGPWATDSWDGQRVDSAE